MVSRLLIVLLLFVELLSLIRCKSLLAHCETHKARHVLLLLPRLNVEANIDEDAILGIWVSVLDHEGARHGCRHTFFLGEHDIDFVLSEVRLRLVDRLGVISLVSLESFLTHEGIMNPGAFLGLIDGDFEVT